MTEKGTAETQINEIATLFSSLPRSYDTLITALEARKEVILTFVFVQQKVDAEYQCRLTNSIYDESESALTVSTEC